jgi:hypothetical protein
MEEKPLEINIKICKLCGSSENKFQHNRRQCTKCLSKKHRNPEYFKTYYEEHREEFITRRMNSYYGSKNKVL